MSTSRLTLCARAALALLLLSTTAHAELVLTDVSQRHECLSPGLYAPVSALERSKRTQFCASTFADSEFMRASCMEQANSPHAMRVFIQDCATLPQFSPYLISVDGKLHPLTARTPPAQGSLLGEYTGRGITVRIEALSPATPTTLTTDSDATLSPHTVRMTVTLGKQQRSFDVVVGQGR